MVSNGLMDMSIYKYVKTKQAVIKVRKQLSFSTDVLITVIAFINVYIFYILLYFKNIIFYLHTDIDVMYRYIHKRLYCLCAFPDIFRKHF